MASTTAAVLLGRRSRFIGVVALAPAILVIAHLLPTTGPGLALRLAGAAACVLLVPGALMLRAFGWPSSPGIAVAASFALSLVAVAFALALVFAAGASITLAVVVLVVVSACAAAPAALSGVSDPIARPERKAVWAVLGAGVLYAGVVWWGAGPLGGDNFFHLARARKLAELDALTTLKSVGEFKNGGLHPGYAFPLWHGVDALVARLAGVDVTSVFLYLPAILVPLALLLAYAAGAAVFRSPAGGLALVALYAAQFGFARRHGSLAGTEFFESLSRPQAASQLLLIAAALALAFAFVADGGKLLLVALGGASLALGVVHGSYAPYLALILGGFVLARVVLVRGWEPLLTRAALALGAIVVPFLVVLAAMLPVISGASSFTPSAGVRAHELHTYGHAFTKLGPWFGLSPDAVARGGPVVVAGLLAVPLAVFAARRLWAALVLGASLLILAVLVTPPVFTLLSDLVSVSQARRLPQFLPISFALAGGCIVLSRLRLVGVALAAAAGVAVTLLYPGEFTYVFGSGGPGWAVWVAVVGGLAALALGAVLRTRGPGPNVWAAAAASALVVPIAVAGLAGLQKGSTSEPLTPGAIAALRSDVPAGAVVFSDPRSAYAATAFAPVYVNAINLGHVADTRANRVRARLHDAWRFFHVRSLTDSERRALLSRWGAGFVLVDDELPHPKAFLRTLRLVYSDRHYSVYEVGS